MRIDLDTRLSFAFTLGWGVVIGAGIASVAGYHVDAAVVSAGGSAVIATLGIGLLKGTANGKKNGGQGEANGEA